VFVVAVALSAGVELRRRRTADTDPRPLHRPRYRRTAATEPAPVFANRPGVPEPALDCPNRAVAPEPASVLASCTLVREPAVSPAGRGTVDGRASLVGLVVGAALVAALATPALAATDPGLQAQPHGEHGVVAPLDSVDEPDHSH